MSRRDPEVNKRRTSVYLNDELEAAVYEDGRTLPELIEAGLDLPSPLRLTTTQLRAVQMVVDLATDPRYTELTDLDGIKDRAMYVVTVGRA